MLVQDQRTPQDQTHYWAGLWGQGLQSFQSCHHRRKAQARNQATHFQGTVLNAASESLGTNLINK